MDITSGSFASFGSDFDPEHEALASTNSPRLPGSARRNIQRNNNSKKTSSRFSKAQPELDIMDDEPDYAINTSAIERAFPEFSQAGSSSEDDPRYDGLLDGEEDEFSLEIGRGAASKPTRPGEDSRNSMMSFENSVRSSSPAVRLDYPTPQKTTMASKSNPSRRATSDNLRKDAQLRRASQAHKENNFDPQPTKSNHRRDQQQQQAIQRRSLSDMHARVRDSYEGSFLGDERPSPAPVNPRSTRFGNVNLSHQIAEAVERASQEARRGGGKGPNGSRTSGVAAGGNGDNTTYQSFLLPDLPNLSELVSGVYEDDGPALPRQNKMRATRFVSPPPGDDMADESVSRQHLPLDAVPVPDDEKALFVSLRVLQERVAELEHAKADAERKIQDMRQENAILKSDRPRGKDKHGRTKGYESEEEYGWDSRLASENQKLEATNLALQNRLDIIDRKAQLSESTLKKLTKERDMAVSQLGVAYLESQDSKTENEKLRRENAELRTQLSKFVTLKSREDTTGRSEQTAATDDGDAEDSQVYTQRSSNVSRNTKDQMSKNARASRSKPVRDEDTRSKVSNQVDKEISRLERERAEEALFSIDFPQSGRVVSKHDRSEGRSGSRKVSNTGKHRVKRVVVEEVDVTDPADTMTEEATRQTRRSSQGDNDLSLLSFVDEREIAQLRKTLEEERLARKQRLAVPKDQTANNETSNTTRQSSNMKPAPRKSSMKESSKIVRPASAIGDITTVSKTSAPETETKPAMTKGRQRRHSDHATSVASPRRRRRDVEDMTSAFILPDITLHHADVVAQDPSKLPESTQRALDSATQHNKKNCTVCKRVLPGDATCDHTHETVQVPKPVPVSERMPEPSVYNEEPTLRPAQSPPVALASVLKSLEDELSHLKMQLATYQGAYNKLDASLGKRQRKTLGEKIEKLLREVDMKADQIYALYDVLEGQKHGGHQMTEHEMEQTLQSIGIDSSPPTPAAADRTRDATATTDRSTTNLARKTSATAAGMETADDDDEDEGDLPWEGIESTMDMTGRTGGSRRD